MADHDPRQVGALRLEEVELVEADRRLDGVGRDREAGPTGGPGRGAVDPLLARRDPRLVRADLADDPGPDAGLAHAIGRLADELVGKRLDRRGGRSAPRPGSRRPDTSRAHHDVQAGRLREPARASPDRARRRAASGRRRSRRRRPETPPAPRRSRARRAAAPSNPSGSRRATGRSPCARVAGSSRARPDRWARGPSEHDRERAVTRRPAPRTASGGAGRPRGGRRPGRRGRGDQQLDHRQDAALGVGAAVAGALLDALEDHAVEQRAEPGGGPVDLEPGRELAAGDALLEQPERRPRGSPGDGGGASRGSPATCPPRPRRVRAVGGSSVPSSRRSIWSNM